MQAITGFLFILPFTAKNELSEIAEEITEETLEEPGEMSEELEETENIDQTFTPFEGELPDE